MLTPAANGMSGAIKKAAQIKQELGDNAVILQQFENPANAVVHRYVKCAFSNNSSNIWCLIPRLVTNEKILHRQTTGPEIWNDTDGRVDILVSGVGTGGTITGVSQYIKPLKSSFKSVAVEPVESPVLSGGQSSTQDSGHRSRFCARCAGHESCGRNSAGVFR